MSVRLPLLVNTCKLSLLHGTGMGHGCSDALADRSRLAHGIVAKTGNARDVLEASKVGIPAINITFRGPPLIALRKCPGNEEAQE